MRKRETIRIEDIPQTYTHDSIASDSLIVLFPGMGYTCEKPLLYYARTKAEDMSMDVLCIDYGIEGFDKARIEESLHPVKELSYQAVKEVLRHTDYKHVYFISKSIGTIAAGYTRERLKRDIPQFYLTPLPQTIPYMTHPDDIAISGTSDPMMPLEGLKQLKQSGIHVRIVEGADHSLQISKNTDKSVEILVDVLKLYDDFLKR